MTKLEEFTALLVNETTDFKNALEKLEKLNAQIKETKIKMDLTEYKTIIESHQRKMASHLESLQGFQNHFDNRIEQAKIYPNWAVVIFIASVILGIGSLVLLLMYYV